MMAAKSAKKAGKKSPAKSAKKPAAKRKAKPKRQAPAIRVQNHSFAPGTEVYFLPEFQVTVERQLNRAPIPSPVAKATVKPNGVLEVRGLTRGAWVASGPVERDGQTFWRYHQFPVNLDR